jgi:hypothetical protein
MSSVSCSWFRPPLRVSHNLQLAKHNMSLVIVSSCHAKALDHLIVLADIIVLVVPSGIVRETNQAFRLQYM